VFPVQVPKLLSEFRKIDSFLFQKKTAASTTACFHVYDATYDIQQPILRWI